MIKTDNGFDLTQLIIENVKQGINEQREKDITESMVKNFEHYKPGFWDLQEDLGGLPENHPHNASFPELYNI